MRAENRFVGGDDLRSELRGAVYRGDGAALVELLGRTWPDHALQLIGDGLGAAVREQAEGAAPLAAMCVAALRVRAWEGDEELADSLERALEPSLASAPAPLPVDLDALAMSLEGDPVHAGGRIDLQTGEVWPQAAVEYAEETGDEDEAEDDPERWLWFDSLGSRDAYQDMERFIASLDNADIADRLAIAIEGPGAFRRFRDTLSRWPELVTGWHAFSEDRRRGRARAWLADQGYSPAGSTSDCRFGAG